ncbi:MAG TPA: universal stress protein [Streptosporangiaceae bacterium]|nr:universal stress protein [Streptosporangiaceae bacterium]
MAGIELGILAGYDGSPGSQEALAWAAAETRSRGSPLTVCSAWAPGYPAMPGEVTSFDLARRSGERTQAQGVQFVDDLMVPVEIQPLLTAGPAAAVLCEHSARAEMLVVGSRGQGGFAGLPMGSVSSQVAAHAHGRIVVVRGHWRRVPTHAPPLIVVGTEGSAASEPAVEFAFEEAACHGTALLAVCALADAPGNLGCAREIEDSFEYLISRWEKAHPEVVVGRHISQGRARTALLDAAGEAQLLVVGARGRGGIEGMMLGSVSAALLQHAPCPVGIVHSG